MNQILVTTSRGLDELLKSEIESLCLDVSCRLSPGTVSFSGTLEQAYTLCLWSRLANRVVWVLAEGPCDSADELYDTASSVDWQQHLRPSNTLSVQFNGTNRAIKNSQFGAVRIKDAIVDQFMEELDLRPSVEKKLADFPIWARCHREKVTIGLDLSGNSLHQRAYRSKTGEAPLKEHVACAMLIRSGWTQDTTKPLSDVFCGSGTIAFEAAYIARNITPGIKRSYWGFNRWLQHNPSLWNDINDEALASQKACETPIYASDIDSKLVNIARKNADQAGVFNDIRFDVCDALKASPLSKEPGYLISNPPYGERLGELTDLIPTFAELGKQLKNAWGGWHVSLLSSNRDLLRVLKLRSGKEYGLNNGKLECRFVNYLMDEDNCRQYGNDGDNHEFANRLKKNLKKLKSWIKQQDTNCYRIYDADLPDYNVAIDVYGEWLVVQEYAPPKTVSEDKARKRLQEVLLHLPAVTGVDVKKIALKVRSQQKGTTQYEKMDQKGERLTVYENGARLLVNLTDYLDTGLFLDHRVTRQMVAKRVKNKDVLNLFSYTGSVSVHAALGGARSVTTVDMSKTYLDWAKDNMHLNKVKGAQAFIQADCTTWLKTHPGKYDFIFIDPPSFSNSKRMQDTFDVQRDHVALLKDAFRCLNDGGEVMFSNNRRGFKLDYEALEEGGYKDIEDISAKTIPDDFARNSNIHKCWVLKK